MKLIYIKLTILFLLAVIPVAAFNYLVDPYGIFNNVSVDLWYEPGQEPNQHYAKMRHLIDDSHSWDSYLFGSSRVGKINPAVMHDGNYYNMNYSEGLPGEHLQDIKVLLENNVPLKNVIIGLDSFSYTMRPDNHMWQMMRQPYDISGFKRMMFKMKYLYSVPQIRIIKNYKFKKSDFLINFNVLGNGMHDLEEVDKRIERNIEDHINSERFHRASNVKFDRENEQKYMAIMEDVIKVMTEIIELSRSYDFSVKVFINPTHYKYYVNGNPFYFLMFKEKLAQVTDYWDFSGLNSITSNNYYYYETSHYRTKVGDLISCRIFNCTSTEVPTDFGVLVTKDNIGSHIKNQKERLLSYEE